MPDVKEVYEMVTQQTPPRQGALERQRMRQRRTARSRRIGAFAAAAIVAGLAIVAGFVARPRADGDRIEPMSLSTRRAGVYGFDDASATARFQPSFPADAEQVTWSSDGSRAAFVQTVAGHEQIFLVDVDGETRQLTSDDMKGCTCGASDPAFSPDGERMAFSGFSSDGVHIYVVNLRTERVRQVSRVPEPPRRATEPTWSPDGTTIAFTVGEYGAVELWTVSLADGRQERIPTPVAGSSPAWSPDGAWIAFAGGVDAESETDIWLVRPDGSDAHVVADLARFDQNPAWSPDSSEIAFTAFHAGIYPPRTAVAIVTVDSAAGRELVDDGRDPSWAPDGVLYLRHDQT